MAQVLHAEALQRATRTMLTMKLISLRIREPEFETPIADAPAVDDAEAWAGQTPTAEDPGIQGVGGCEGSAAEGEPAALPDVTSGGPAARECKVARSLRPANAGQRPPKIAIGDAPSGMEAAAERWHAPVRIAESVAAERVEQAAAGMVWCKCGGADGGHVPASFGRNCIEGDCPLRGVR